MSKSKPAVRPENQRKPESALGGQSEPSVMQDEITKVLNRRPTGEMV